MLFFFVGRFRELGELGVVVPACGVAPPQVVVPAVDGDPFAGAVLEIVLVPAFDDVSATVAPDGVSDDCLHRFSPLFDLKTGSLPPLGLKYPRTYHYTIQRRVLSSVSARGEGKARKSVPRRLGFIIKASNSYLWKGNELASIYKPVFYDIIRLHIEGDCEDSLTTLDKTLSAIFAADVDDFESENQSTDDFFQ